MSLIVSINNAAQRLRELAGRLIGVADDGTITELSDIARMLHVAAAEATGGEAVVPPNPVTPPTTEPAPSPADSAPPDQTVAPPDQTAPPPATDESNGLPAGVTLIDPVNGLVRIEATESIFPGQGWACIPTLAVLTPGSQAYATVDYNCSTKKNLDDAHGLADHSRVNTMVPATIAGVPSWTNSSPFVWLEHARTVGAEFATWPTAIAEAVRMATNMAMNPNTLP